MFTGILHYTIKYYEVFIEYCLFLESIINYALAWFEKKREQIRFSSVNPLFDLLYVSQSIM